MGTLKDLQAAIINADDFQFLDIPVKRKILSPWLTEGSITQISGWRGTGKTWFGLSLFKAVTSGQRFGPWLTDTPVSALYVDAEMSAYDVQERLRQLPDIDTSESRETVLKVYSDAYASSLGIPRANLLNKTWRETIAGICQDDGIRLLGLDNVSTLAPGLDENSKQAWDPVNQWLLSLRFAGIATAFFHHTNKMGDQRGTSGREDNLDASIILQRPADYATEQGARFVVRFKKARVRTSDLKLMQDIEFTLTETEGKVAWSYKSAKNKTQNAILSMIDEGVPQSEIARALGIDRSYVCKVKAKATERDWLNKCGKLTSAGKEQLSFLDNDDPEN